MPNIRDFSILQDIKTVTINPEGWIEDIIVEYGINEDYVTSYNWRVSGTQHTFVIPVTRMNYINSGNYESHFKEVLENFAIEYKEWKKTNFLAKWMQEYRNEYRNYIL